MYRSFVDIDPIELKEQAEESSKSRLNSMVAVTIALLATFMGICKVKDDNIVQAMQQAQADKLDHWSYYQARNTQLKTMQATADFMRVEALSGSPEAKALAAKQTAFYAAEAKRLNEEKDKIKSDAEDDEKKYNALNVHDDQFDLSDALLALAISLLAITSLTQKKWLYWVAMVPTAFGILMGLSGLLGWGIHPDAITNLLSMLATEAEAKGM